MRVLQFLIFLTCALTAHSSEKTDWPQGSAMYAGLSQKEILVKKQETAANLAATIQANLEEHSPYKGKYLSDLLAKSHHNWKGYIDSTCMVVGAMTGSGGSWPTYYALKCEANMTDQRLFKLTNTLRCIKKHARNKRKYDIPACLYQSFSIEY